MAIEFDKVSVGDKVRVVGAGAPGFAALGDVLTITKIEPRKVWCARQDGEEAFFALTCGAARLDPIAT